MKKLVIRLIVALGLAALLAGASYTKEPANWPPSEKATVDPSVKGTPAKPRVFVTAP
jgi:predicted small lipoprotein YifL